jgi:hypothetical protein
MALVFRQGDARDTNLKPKVVDMTFGSPPYLNARRYGRKDIARGLDEWVNELMLPATVEALRVTRGPVFWVVAGVTEDKHYVPGPEALVAKAAEAGIRLWRPCIWHKNGLPGSGGK